MTATWMSAATAGEPPRPRERVTSNLTGDVKNEGAAIFARVARAARVAFWERQGCRAAFGAR